MAMLKRFGSNYGGWTVETDLISDNDLILAAGIGGDISFEQGLFNHNNTLKFFGYDPNTGGQNFLNKTASKELLSSYSFHCKAVAAKSGSFKTFDNITCDAHGFQELISHIGFSVVKLDIEGSEYECINSVTDWGSTIKQVAVEFHHWVPSFNKTIEDTHYSIDKLTKDGFKLVYHKVNVPERKIQECLFIRKELTNLPEIKL